ncbi:hypothetical protein EYB53_009015 [Candidatus Chloroploca sp. M-50]|uniref:Uncharacterized protein n=1 Tax=Candidatus Chloroploca mongolica TaxID=2528176 RepID=A0ABS4D8T6_9CHLR|nr:hypothetical protein [Candidatus Chloroploca mongolica]MBP1465842.1 hypothetical protein [Candidatus Chloroploca mongolica]
MTIAINPTAPGSLAPDPATAVPSPEATSLPAQTFTPLPSLEPPPAPEILPTLAVPPPPQLTYEERWRLQQIDRQIFAAPIAFATTGSELWWYDPVQQQSVILGRINGPFVAQARFILRGQGVEAFEVPYQVNVGYGLTALSPALLERIRVAGFSDWIETYVFVGSNITPL